MPKPEFLFLIHTYKDARSVGDAARSLFGKSAAVDRLGTVPTDHPDWKLVGSVALNNKTHNIYRIPEVVNRVKECEYA